jgi:hypothetical protein
VEQNIIKYKKLERFINKIEFKEIKVGSLLTEKLDLSYYKETRLSYIKALLVFLKYLLTLPISKIPKHRYSKFIFTKLGNRFHLNELMDPLIVNYLNQSTIICNDRAFDPKLSETYSFSDRCVMTKQTLANNNKDTFQIIWSTFKVLFVFIKFKRRLQVSKNELVQYTLTSLIQFRKSSYWDDYFKRCVIKPKGIITESDRNGNASPLILNAKKYNILTITLTHGVINEYGTVPVLADHIFCWGESQKRQLIDMGVASQRISKTGNPMIKAFNQHPFEPHTSHNEIRVCLAISPEADSINKSLIEPFIYAVEQVENVEGIIKLHPSLKKENYKWIYSLSSSISIYESVEITNEELFKAIDLLIVHFSGIANEALAAGTPVMIMEPEGLSNLNYFQNELIQNAGCKVVVNSIDLIAIFDEYRANPELFRLRSIQKSEYYLKDMYEIIGKESVRAMITTIDRISGEQ